MIPTDSQTYESFVPVYDAIPEKWEDARDFLVEHLKKISNAVNIREIGWFLDEELLSGKTLFPGMNVQGNESPLQNRQILRQCYNFGALPNTTTKSIAHNVTVDANFTLIALYAGAYDPVHFIGLSIPFASTAGVPVQIDMDVANINIHTLGNFSNYSNTIIVMEYAQEL